MENDNVIPFIPRRILDSHQGIILTSGKRFTKFDPDANAWLIVTDDCDFHKYYISEWHRFKTVY